MTRRSRPARVVGRVRGEAPDDERRGGRPGPQERQHRGGVAPGERHPTDVPGPMSLPRRVRRPVPGRPAYRGGVVAAWVLVALAALAALTCLVAAGRLARPGRPRRQRSRPARGARGR